MCSSIFLEPVNKIVGLAHAGWRGTLSEISRVIISQIITRHDGKKENLQVFIGPSICGKCYKVDHNRYQLFQNKFKLPPNKRTLDLKAINAKILLNTGIKIQNIEVSPYCTSCNNDQFFSYRSGDKGKMVGVIGMK